MKIAIISDIHANKLAFDAVMKDIDDFKPDKIFCLGDLILAGYDSNYICEQIISLKNKLKEDFKIIQGNTDKMIAYCNDEMIEKTKNVFPCMGYSLEQDVKTTKTEYIDFVKNLNEDEIIEINGLKIHLCHGSPRNQTENIYPDLKEQEVEKMVENSSADLILCGHTHIPCGYSLNNGKTIVNVGSIGRSKMDDKMPIYVQLTIDKNGKFFIEHKKVKYDNKKVSQLILERNFLHCEDLAKMYV